MNKENKVEQPTKVQLKIVQSMGASNSAFKLGDSSSGLACNVRGLAKYGNSSWSSPEQMLIEKL